MADAIRVSDAFSGTDKTLSFETGKLAQQSQGAVVASLGRTTVLSTANAAKGVRDGIDFFPLTVDVEERAYAAGKIPGAFSAVKVAQQKWQFLLAVSPTAHCALLSPMATAMKHKSCSPSLVPTRKTHTTFCRSTLHPHRS